MTTPQQIQANQQNAQKSTGPVTEEGKAKVAQNAVTHGLSAQGYLIEGEDPDVFEAFRSQRLEQWLQPVGLLEEGIAEELISVEWRLRRIKLLEAQAFAEKHTFDDRIMGLTMLDRHERSLMRKHKHLSESLEEYQESRLEKEEAAMQELEMAEAREKEQKVWGSMTHEELYQARERIYVQLFMASNAEEQGFWSQRFEDLDGFVLSKFGELPPPHYKSLLFDPPASPDSNPMDSTS